MKGRADRFLVGAAVVAGTVTAALLLPVVRTADRTIRNLADAHRPELADTVAQWVNRLGSGGLLTSVALVIATVAGLRTRSLRPVALVIAAFLATGLLIAPLKLVLDRAAPHAGGPELFGGGVSYPSGHAVNAVVWYGVIAALLGIGSTWWRWIPPILVTAAGTYLGYHWLTDMLAGLALGVLLDRLLHRFVGLPHDHRVPMGTPSAWSNAPRVPR